VDKFLNPLNELSTFILMKGKKKKLSIQEKIANAEKILAGKKSNPKGLKQFEEVLKKAVAPKRHGSK
jgi:hypothetical protein